MKLTKILSEDVSRKLMEFSFYSFIILYPFSVKWSNATILFICFFGFFSSSLQYKIEVLKHSKGLWIYVSFFLLLALGLTYSLNARNGFNILERSVYFLILPLLFATASPLSKEVISRFLQIFVTVTLAISILSIILNVNYFITNDLEFGKFFDWEYTYQHLASSIGLHPTYFVMMILISFFVTLFKFQSHRLYGKIGKAMLLIFFFAFLLLLGTKIGILIFFILVNATLLAYAKGKGIKFVAVYFIFNFLIIFSALNTHVIYWRFRVAIESTIRTLTSNEVSDYRLIHWMCATQVIKEEPLMGYGTGDAKQALNECYISVDQSALLNYNAHNQLLDSWIKLGLPGLLLTFLCLSFPFYKAFQSGDHLFAIIFSIFIFVAFTESLLTVQRGIVLFALLVSLYFGHIQGIALKKTHQTV